MSFWIFVWYKTGNIPLVIPYLLNRSRTLSQISFANGLIRLIYGRSLDTFDVAQQKRVARRFHYASFMLQRKVSVVSMVTVVNYILQLACLITLYIISTLQVI